MNTSSETLTEYLKAVPSAWPMEPPVVRFADVYSTAGFQAYAGVNGVLPYQSVKGVDLYDSWSKLHQVGSFYESLEKHLGVPGRSVLTKHWFKLVDIQESAYDISDAIKILQSETVYRSSASRVQAIKSSLNLSRTMVKGLYYSILRDLKRLLSTDDFNKLRRELAGHIESMQSTFSRMTKKIKAVTRLVSSAGFTIDRRQEFRKKLKVILRQSDEEDSI